MANRQEIENILANDEQLSAVTAAVFGVVDVDGSGHIDRSELKNAMVNVAREANIAAPNDEQVDKAMNALDANQDGKISVEEFKVLIRGLLTAIAGIEANPDIEAVAAVEGAE